jgi:hypothetical protein
MYSPIFELYPSGNEIAEAPDYARSSDRCNRDAEDHEQAA